MSNLRIDVLGSHDAGLGLREVGPPVACREGALRCIEGASYPKDLPSLYQLLLGSDSAVRHPPCRMCMTDNVQLPRLWNCPRLVYQPCDLDSARAPIYPLIRGRPAFSTLMPPMNGEERGGPRATCHD